MTNLEVLGVGKEVTSCKFSRKRLTVYEKDCIVIVTMCNCYKLVMIAFPQFPATNQKRTQNRVILRISCYLMLFAGQFCSRLYYVLLNSISNFCLFGFFLCNMLQFPFSFVLLRFKCLQRELRTFREHRMRNNW